MKVVLNHWHWPASIYFSSAACHLLLSLIDRISYAPKRILLIFLGWYKGCFGALCRQDLWLDGLFGVGYAKHGHP